VKLTNLIHEATLLTIVLTLYGCGGNTIPKVSTTPPSVTQPSPTPQWSPQITSISPASAIAGGPSFELVVNGTGFKPPYPDQGPGYIYFGSSMVQTTSRSATQMVAKVPAEFIATTGSVSVVVGYTDLGSNPVNFDILPAAPTVLPSADSLGLLGARQFAVSGFGENPGIVWSVKEGPGGGMVTSTGLYTAPGNAGIFHVIAATTSDSSITASATVTVTLTGSNFTQTGDMHVARIGHTATLLADGDVLVTGGDQSAEIFDPATESFTVTGNTTSLRYGATATLLADGKVLVADGFGDGKGPLPRLGTAELFDPTTGTFSATGSMLYGRVLHTATLLNDGRVLIAGGTTEAAGGGEATASAEIFDPTTGTFGPCGWMSSERARHTATLLTNGKVLIAGGFNGHAADSPDDPPWDPLFAELFDPSTNSFVTTDSISTTRSDASAVRMLNGKVLVLGGIAKIQNLHEQPTNPSYAELYDPSTGMFSPVPNISLAPSSFTATLLPSGVVLVAGGIEGAAMASSADLIDPTNSRVLPTGSLLTGRSGHTATRLNDGRVLITGGVDSSAKPLVSAEIFH
jgi:hypothetical protein